MAANRRQELEDDSEKIQKIRESSDRGVNKIFVSENLEVSESSFY